MTQRTQHNSEAADEVEAFAENSVLTKLFGNTPRAKILSALLSESDRDVNITEIAKLTGMSRSTIYKHIDPLTELGVLEYTRDVGGSPMYQINRESQVAKDVAYLNWDLMDEDEQ